MTKKGKSGGKSRTAKSSGKSGTVIVAVIALLVGVYIGGVLVPAFKDSAAPRGTGTGGASPAAQIEDTKRALQKQPDSAELWTQLGNLYFDTDQHADAIEAYTKSLAIKPDDPHVLIDLGVMYRRHGEPQKAVQYFDKAIAVSPEHETAHFNKGIVLYYDIKDKAAGIKAWEELIKINPSARTPKGGLVKDMIRDLS